LTAVPTSARRFPWLVYWLVLLLILILAVLPLVSALAAGAVASANGCALDEGSIHPCLIGGVDRGELLYQLGVLGWLMLATIPLGAVGAVVWAIVLAIHRARFNRRSGVR
jgi:hypothetical protein